MRLTLLAVLFLTSLFIGCFHDDDPPYVGEEISSPSQPVGPDTAGLDEPVTFNSGGAVSSSGHALEYRFDFDASNVHDYSEWATASIATAVWSRPGVYVVKAQARCSSHTGVVSLWSPGKTVAVAVEAVSTPRAPEGPSRLTPGRTVIHCSGGAASTRGHPLQYRFWIGEDPLTPYSVWHSSPCVMNTWDSLGTFPLRAQARCAIHTDRVSDWSDSLDVIVTQVEQVPAVHFATSITRIGPGVHETITKPYDPAVLDTVGMFRPLSISYHGTSPNGSIEAYKFFPLTAGVGLPGENVWTTDLSDTIRTLNGAGNVALPSGVFKLAAQCRDEAGAESPVDEAEYTEGVCQVVVNFDPETEIMFITSLLT